MPTTDKTVFIFRELGFVYVLNGTVYFVTDYYNTNVNHR